MIKIDPTILLILGEVILALLLVTVGLIVFIWKSRKRERDSVSAADELRFRVKNSAPERQEWFQQVLAECIESSDPEVNRELAANWMGREALLYTSLLNMYLKRDAATLRGFDRNVEGYAGIYHDLIALIRTRIDQEHDSVPAEVAAQLEQLTAAVQTLEQENQRLNSEVLSANNEMDQAMREYSVAFRPGSGMTGSASAVVGVVAAQPDLEEAQAKPAAAVVAVADVDQRPETDLDELLGDELDTLSAEIMAGSGEESDASSLDDIGEMDVDSLDEQVLSAADPDHPSTVLSDDWGAAFDELPDADVAEKGPVIDLSDEGDIVLPQLNELMAALDSSEQEDDDWAGEVMGDELSDQEPPLLDERVVSEEDELLAQLEGLDDMDMPSLADAFSEEELANITKPPAPAVSKPPKA